MRTHPDFPPRLTVADRGDFPPSTPDVVDTSTAHRILHPKESVGTSHHRAGPDDTIVGQSPSGSLFSDEMETWLRAPLLGPPVLQLTGSSDF
jgi:hypothetical protein